MKVSFSSARVRIMQVGNIRMGVNAAGSGICFTSDEPPEEHYRELPEGSLTVKRPAGGPYIASLE